MRTPLLILACSALLGADAATFTVNYNLAPPEAQAAIDHAAGIWADILVSPVPIKVLVNWVPLGPGALGITFPNGRRDFPAAPLPQTWYVTALANSIDATELNPGENDFEIYLNSSVAWYFGTDGDTPSGQYDLVSVALHEMGHGIGFVGLSKKTGTEGSFGLLELADFAPLTTTFPWPQLDTLPSIFDRFLAHPQNGPLDLMDNPGSALGSAMTSNQLRFNGPLVMADNGGNAPRIYSPSTFALGSSCVHLNETTYPVGNENELMTPFSASGHANHWPGPLCLAMLRDIGWTLSPDVGIHERVEGAAIRVYPNPATDRLWVTFTGDVSTSFSIVDPQGRTVRTVIGPSPLDVHDIPPGSYLLRCINGGRVVRFQKY